MHTISHDQSHIHFNSDFSGEVLVTDGERSIAVPGALIQKVVEHCVDDLMDKIKEHLLALPVWPWGKSVYDKKE